MSAAVAARATARHLFVPFSLAHPFLTQLRGLAYTLIFDDYLNVNLGP